MSLLGNDACVHTEFKLSFVKLSCNPEARGAGCFSVEGLHFTVEVELKAA